MVIVTPHRRLWLLSLAGAVLASGVPTESQADCRALLPVAPLRQHEASHLVSTRDLLSLRDIGQPDTMFGESSPVAVSPDRRSASFIMTQADPATNAYCRGVVVIDLAGRRPPRLVDSGGTLITESAPYRGYMVKGGFPALIVPSWSADGRWIAYLRRDRGITQIWRAAADGGGAQPVSRSPVDVEDWAWSADGKAIVYAARPQSLEVARQIEASGHAGWLYDASISPDYGPRPQMPATVKREIFKVDARTGATQSLGDETAAGDWSASANAPAALDATYRGRLRAKVHARTSSPFSSTEIIVDRIGQSTIRCSADACAHGIQNLWWDSRGRALLFLRREGWRDEQMALYTWRPGHGGPHRLFATRNLLFGCQMLAAGLLCLSEDATHPRSLVMIGPSTGRVKILFDPNPEAASWRFGSVRRLRWKNDQGLEAWGDLVLPPDYRRGSKVPLVVVQYHSNGFLRGGTGDEYPIYPLAARGIAVLSFERPMFVAAADPKHTSWDDIIIADQKNWAERRSLLSAISRGVAMAIQTGAIDGGRMGITGLSDGASSVRFALLNASLFKAAAISTCCLDPKTVMTYGGIAWADYNLSIGYPPATRDDPDYWKPYSLALGAATMKTPLLMQLADSELLLALEAYEALREHRQPVELFVYPDEFHIKWQPLHRSAIYERNLDWFAFWLQGRIDPTPTKSDQYRRWQALRARADDTAARP